VKFLVLQYFNCSILSNRVIHSIGPLYLIDFRPTKDGSLKSEPLPFVEHVFCCWTPFLSQTNSVKH